MNLIVPNRNSVELGGNGQVATAPCSVIQLPGIIPVFRYDDGHSFSTTQSAQSGLRALQIFRPCAIKRCEKMTQSFFGTISIRSSSIFSAVFCLVRPRRWD